jgi:hypothetical protein
MAENIRKTDLFIITLLLLYGSTAAWQVRSRFILYNQVFFAIYRLSSNDREQIIAQEADLEVKSALFFD